MFLLSEVLEDTLTRCQVDGNARDQNGEQGNRHRVPVLPVHLPHPHPQAAAAVAKAVGISGKRINEVRLKP